MNEALWQVLRGILGDRLIERPEGTIGIPSSEAELLSVLEALRGHRAEMNRELFISRARLDAIGPVDQMSALVRVGAGSTLAAIERAANPVGLSLGPLTPRARALDLGSFLEGAYAGLRAIPGGRLEPLALALDAVMPDGTRFVSRPAPRSAAGPDLDAFFFGGLAAAGMLVNATVRLMPLPVATRSVAFLFSTAPRVLLALRHAAADGCWLETASVRAEGRDFILEARAIGNARGVERDLASVSRRAIALGGRAAPLPPPHLVPDLSAGVEREVSWDALATALAQGQSARLYRISLESIVVDQPIPGADLTSPGPTDHPLWGQLLATLDPEHRMGGPA